MNSCRSWAVEGRGRTTPPLPHTNVRSHNNQASGLYPDESWAEEGRGRTTPPALNFANYLTIRALTYAEHRLQASGLLLAAWGTGLRPDLWHRGINGSAMLLTSRIRVQNYQNSFESTSLNVKQALYGILNFQRSSFATPSL